MINKWLVVSSISTVLGFLAGVIYLLFAEHSLLLSNSGWVLSAFWSTFMLWIFIFMFVLTLVLNIIVFIELDSHHSMLTISLPSLISIKQRQQQFIATALGYLESEGVLKAAAHENQHYLTVNAEAKKLVYIQHRSQRVDISVIRQLFQQMLAEDIREGVVVSYSGFSGQAWIFAKEANIQLIDQKSIKKQHKQYNKQQFALI
ncbi:restriction endonuclease [Rheinheimera sp. WS51]|uniref:restriction endonuclease n=1 Tax=Rheinheimera sp. WS51 TaxID=3425886 RepID=UPI003D90A124